jgi:hypothetical protein
MNPTQFFASPRNAVHRRYEALRCFFLEDKPALEVAHKFGYKLSAFYSMTRDFRKLCVGPEINQQFFVIAQPGRKPRPRTTTAQELIVQLRKKYLSVPDIKATLDAQRITISEKHIYNLIRKEGFARLPRRTINARDETLASATLEAPKSQMLDWMPETFQTHQSLGILCFLPSLQHYGILRAIKSSKFPQTHVISRLSSILSFLALKLSGTRRYTHDDQWCMDRGLGLFAELNVLPKAAWFTSYSHRVTRQMNLDFLKKLHQIWIQHGLLSDTANLDFVSIPYWGDDTHLENNWSGTRHSALASILAVLAQDPQSGFVTYGDANVRHRHKSDVVVEFLDFYKTGAAHELKYLVFDSKFTTYQNLRKLDDNSVKFITIRRRGENLVRHLDALPASDWKSLRVPAAHGKGRTLSVNEQMVVLREYGKPLRQVAIRGHGRIKPALLLTNDFDLAVDALVRKYAQRWLVEQEIAEQTYFFHLNRVSSSMVIKVDFDLTMTLLAHNLYRLLAADLPGYSQTTAQSLFNRFILNSGEIRIQESAISVGLKKKRHLPALLTAMHPFRNLKISSLKDKYLFFLGATSS